jgi:hypothetical protein
VASIVGCRCSRGSATVYCFVGFLDRYSPSIVRDRKALTTGVIAEYTGKRGRRSAVN